METRKNDKIIRNFKKYFLSKKDHYFFKRINLEKIKLDQKKYLVTKIAGKKSKLFNNGHSLDLKSYLTLIVPRRFHKQLLKCDFFYLIRGEEKEALNFFKKKGCETAIIIRNKFAKKRFERFLVSYNKKNKKLYCSFYNIASLQRLRHYELLLKSIYMLSSKKYSLINHLSVPTPLVETKNFVIKNSKKFSTVDVELYDIIKNSLDSKRKILFGVALLVSDRPGRKENCAIVDNEHRFQYALKFLLERITKIAVLG